MIEYSSLNTIIQTIAVISASIHGIHVRFNHSATMKGNNQRVIFFINQFWSFLLSICSHLAFAESNQNTKSSTSITVIMMSHSQLIQKYSKIQAVVNHQKIHTANHSASVILHTSKNKNECNQAQYKQELEQCDIELHNAHYEQNEARNQ